MASNHTPSAVDQWRDGEDFSFAWYKFADRNQRDPFSKTTTTGTQATYRMLMVAELWAALRDGRLLAFGKCVAPTISDGPVLIPAHTFELRPPHGIEDSDVIEISGWRYEAVRIAENDSQPLPEASAPQESPSCAKCVPDISEPAPENSNRTKRGGGNRNLYNDVKAILSELFNESPAYQSQTAGRLLTAFNQRYTEKYSAPDLKIAPLSPRTLHTHLKRYSQELAKICK